MDIFNNEERRVVCVSNEDPSTLWCKKNAPMLTVGETYTVRDIDVHSWHTIVYLREFPGVGFNSVLFEEIDE